MNACVCVCVWVYLIVCSHQNLFAEIATERKFRRNIMMYLLIIDFWLILPRHNCCLMNSKSKVLAWLYLQQLVKFNLIAPIIISYQVIKWMPNHRDNAMSCWEGRTTTAQNLDSLPQYSIKIKKDESPSIFLRRKRTPQNTGEARQANHHQKELHLFLFQTNLKYSIPRFVQSYLILLACFVDYDNIMSIFYCKPCALSGLSPIQVNPYKFSEKIQTSFHKTKWYDRTHHT